MADDLHSPSFRGIRSDDTSDSPFRYRYSWERGKDGLIADFNECGRDQSFHLASGKEGASLEESLAGHQNLRDKFPGLQPRAG